jgi:hypothetical protein
LSSIEVRCWRQGALSALVAFLINEFRRLKNGVAQDQSDPSKPDYLMTPFSAANAAMFNIAIRAALERLMPSVNGTPSGANKSKSRKLGWLAAPAKHAIGHGTSAEASQVGENTDQTARLRQTPPKRLIQAPAAFALAITIAVAPRESSWLIFCARLRKS